MDVRTQIITILRAHHYGVLATELPAGGPHVAVVSYSFVEDPLQLFFCTESRSIKAQNLLHDRRAAMVVGWDDTAWTTVQMRGTAEVIGDSLLLMRTKGLHYERHPGLRQLDASTTLRFFCFTPGWIRFSNFVLRQPLLGYAAVNTTAPRNV